MYISNLDSKWEKNDMQIIWHSPWHTVDINKWYVETKPKVYA